MGGRTLLRSLKDYLTLQSATIYRKRKRLEINELFIQINPYKPSEGLWRTLKGFVGIILTGRDERWRDAEMVFTPCAPCYGLFFISTESSGHLLTGNLQKSGGRIQNLEGPKMRRCGGLWRALEGF